MFLTDAEVVVLDQVRGALTRSEQLAAPLRVVPREAELNQVLCARLAEAEATVANERGEGPPPSAGWTYHGDIWMHPCGSVQRVRGSNRRPDRWRRTDGQTFYPTARAAMLADDARSVLK